MDITKLPLQELKALAFDQMNIKAQAENNLRLLSDAIIAKENEAAQKKPKLKPKPKARR